MQALSYTLESISSLSTSSAPIRDSFKDLAGSISSRVYHTHPIPVLQSQDLADGSDSEDESKLGVPTPGSDLRFTVSQSKTDIPRLPSNAKHGWAVAGAPTLPSPGPRRAPISLGLSLKQQVSSPRCLSGGARHC